jgi:hypothetical protein
VKDLMVNSEAVRQREKTNGRKAVRFFSLSHRLTVNHQILHYTATFLQSPVG